MAFSDNANIRNTRYRLGAVPTYGAPGVFYKKGALNNFSQFKRKHLFQSFVFDNFIKKENPIFFKDAYFLEHLRMIASVNLSVIRQKSEEKV